MSATVIRHTHLFDMFVSFGMFILLILWLVAVEYLHLALTTDLVQSRYAPRSPPFY